MRSIKQIYVNVLFEIGDFISNTWLYSKTSFGYKIYLRLMKKSYRLQIKWDLPKPWKDID